MSDKAGSGATGADAEFLRVWLERRDAPCPVCGYNLRLLTGDICPECGQQFRLGIGSVHPPFGRLLLLISPMLMISGVALMFVVIAIIKGLPGPRDWGAYVMMIAGVGTGAMTIHSYRRRTWFIRKSRRVQVSLIVLCWLSCISLLCFGFTLGF